MQSYAEAVTIGDVWPGAGYATDAGPVWMREVCYPATFQYGPSAIEHLPATIPERALPLLGPELQAMGPRRALFLDTETTGLAGGTGTYAFLIGVARWMDGSLYFRQYFLNDLSEERAMLAALHEFAAGCDALVTFNGKAFDLPLLSTRHTMHRRRFALQSALHLDLLWPARRLWQRRLASCSLSTLEEEILGLSRTGDIPGALIPERYFNYLRTRDTSKLIDVFDHNRRDVLAMVSLATLMCTIAEDPARTVRHPQDFLALGKLYLRHGMPEVAEPCLRRALSGRLPARDKGWAWFWLAAAVAKLDRVGESIDLFRQAVASQGPAALEAAIVLAKHFEHHAHDYDAAADATADAMLMAHSIEEQHDLQHRMERLYRKRHASQVAVAELATRKE